MRLFPSRPSLRGLGVALLCLFAAACASAPEQPACEPYRGLDPGCLISRPLLKEATDSYQAHFKTMPVGDVVALTERGVPLPFRTHWLRVDKFIVIDFSKPAYEKRLYVVDFKTGKVEAFQVSHGRGSAVSDRSYLAKRFTNIPGSGTSSVGAFVGGQEYVSDRWGRAIRVRGLDATNSMTLQRTIVFHSNPIFFDKKRNIFGWSCGCFMMDQEDLPKAIAVLQDGGFVYAGPIALFDKSSIGKTSECNPWCGDIDKCTTAANANPIGSLPNVAAPPPRPDPQPYSIVPNPNPGDIPVPSQKPPGIAHMPPLASHVVPAAETATPAPAMPTSAKPVVAKPGATKPATKPATKAGPAKPAPAVTPKAKPDATKPADKKTAAPRDKKATGPTAPQQTQH